MPIGLLGEQKEVGEKSPVLVQDVERLVGGIQTLPRVSVQRQASAEKSGDLSDRAGELEEGPPWRDSEVPRTPGTCHSTDSGLTAVAGHMGHGLRETTNKAFR